MEIPEQMIIYKTEQVTSYNKLSTINLSRNGKCRSKDGGPCDLAPTMWNIMEEQKPKEMTGESLLIRK